MNNSPASKIRSVNNAIYPWSECFKSCNQHPNCHFVEFKSTNSCVLFDKSSNFTQLLDSSKPSEALVLFSRNKFQKQYVDGVRLTGEQTRLLENLSSIDTCWDECLIWKSCAAITFNTSSSNCLMFKKESYKILNDSEFITIGFQSEKIAEKSDSTIEENNMNNQTSLSVYWFVQLQYFSRWRETTTVEESQIKCWEKCKSIDGCVTVSFNTVSRSCLTFSRTEIENVQVAISQDYVTLSLGFYHGSLKSKISSFVNRNNGLHG